MVSARHLVCLLPALASAFKVPVGQADGVYSVRVDENGNEVHEPLGALKSRDLSARTSEKLNRRIDPAESWCGCDNPLSQPDCDTAVNMLKAQLGDGVDITLPSYYSISNSVVAFVCVPDEFSISANDLGAYLADVTQACGEYIAGTVMGYDYGLEAYIGYMATTGDFCSAATSSGAHSC